MPSTDASIEQRAHGPWTLGASSNPIDHSWIGVQCAPHGDDDFLLRDSAAQHSTVLRRIRRCCIIVRNVRCTCRTARNVRARPVPRPLSSDFVGRLIAYSTRQGPPMMPQLLSHAGFAQCRAQPASPTCLVFGASPPRCRMLAVALVSVRYAPSNAVARCAHSSLCSLVLTNARPSKRNASGGTLKYHLDDSAHSEVADEHGPLFGEEPLEHRQRDGPDRCLWSSIPPPAAACTCGGKQCACALANSASTVSLTHRCAVVA